MKVLSKCCYADVWQEFKQPVRCKNCLSSCLVISSFDRAGIDSPLVAKILDAGGTAEDCVVELLSIQKKLLDRISFLDSIAPRKIRAEDGRLMVWRCPEDMIPEIVTNA